MAVATQYNKDIPECVEQHYLGRHSGHGAERVVQLVLSRVKPDLGTVNGIVGEILRTYLNFNATSICYLNHRVGILRRQAMIAGHKLHYS